MDSELARALRAQPVFAAATEDGAARLADASRVVSLDAGRVLFGQDDPSDAAYIVLSGAIVIGTVSEDGQDVHFADLGPGTLFGELAVIDGGPRTAGATARGPTRLACIPGDALLRLVRAEAEVAMALLRDVSAKLRATDISLEDRNVLTLEDRLAKFLRAEADARGRVAMTQAQIAERLSVSREAVNRRLRALEEAGAVSLRRGRLDVLRPDWVG